MRPRALHRLGMTLLGFGLISTALGSWAAVAAATPATTTSDPATTVTTTAADPSAQTQKWAEPQFVGPRDATSASYSALSNLSITVSQTRDITNQGVTVSWTGGRPTSVGNFAHDYLQVMQCWGDATTGPTPEQCAWGAPTSGLSNLMGDRTGLRSLKVNEDPAQEYTDKYRVTPPVTQPNLRAYAVPFTTVDGESNVDVSSYFTSATTNEVTAARTGDDGTGEVVFTTQTSLEAPYLGCGATMASGKPRACWLVVVPRGDVTANGTPVAETPDGYMTGSPLSATNWANRVVFSMDFQAIGSSCDMGNAERRLVGHELFTDAMVSWQSSLCGSGTTYGYSQIGDAEARSQIVSSVQGASRLAVVSKPLTKEQSGTSGVTYSPIARNALVVAFNIDRDYSQNSDLIAQNGTPVTSLTLNARLVAKLLTQSYRADVPGGGSSPPLSTNPRSIVTDPEFVALNPEFKDFVPSTGPEGLLVSLGSSDAVIQVWDWIRSDPEGRSFLRGEDDGYGMTINPAYKALDLATAGSTDSFPKADLTNYRQNSIVPEPGYGTLDLRPYMSDMHEAARRAQRADSGAKIVWDPYKLPAGFTSSGAQLPGHRFELALTDRVSAERYGLRTAALVNQAGQPTLATDSTINKAISTMPADADNPTVKVYDGTVREVGTYPLSTVSYAAVSVCLASTDELKDYASFLDFAATTGQKSGRAKGELPTGYVPLTAADITSTTSLAATLRSPAKVAKICPTTKASPQPSSTPTAKPSATATPTTAAPTRTNTTTPTSTDSPSTPVPSATAASTPSEPQATAAAQVTIGPSTTIARMGAIGALGLGLPSALIGPALMRRARLG